MVINKEADRTVLFHLWIHSVQGF